MTYVVIAFLLAVAGGACLALDVAEFRKRPRNNTLVLILTILAIVFLLISIWLLFGDPTTRGS